MKWDTSKAGEYKPEKVYAVTRDKKGFSTPVRGNIPTDLAGHIDRIAYMHGSPWGSKSAFIADAVYHRLVQVESLGLADNPDLSRSLNRSLGAVRTMQLEAESKELAKDVEDVKEAFSTAWNLKDYLALEAMLGDVRLRMDYVREPFRTQLQELCDAFREKLEAYRDVIDQWRKQEG